MGKKNKNIDVLILCRDDGFKYQTQKLIDGMIGMCLKFFILSVSIYYFTIQPYTSILS